MNAIFDEARVPPPTTKQLRLGLHGGVADEDFRDEVRTFHLDVLGSLSVASDRLGRAYTLGRALHEIHDARDIDVMIHEFRFHRIGGLCRTLEDLEAAFPPHSARAVAMSLRRWRDSVEAGAAAEHTVGDQQRLSDALLRQGDLWRALLTGERRAIDTLRSVDYVDAAVGLAADSQELLGRVLRRYAPTLIAAAAVVAVGAGLAIAATGAAEVVAAVATAAAALGFLWKGVGSATVRLAAAVRQPLWKRQLDKAVARAIDQFPGELRAAERRSRRWFGRADQRSLAESKPEPRQSEPSSDSLDAP